MISIPRATIAPALALLLLAVAAADAQVRPGSVGRADPPWLVEERDRRVVLSVPGMDEVVVRRDVAYREAEGAPLTMDLYLPPRLAADDHRPVVILIHGGALPPNLLTAPKDWGEFRSLGELVAASGFAGVTFNHRFFSSMASLPSAESDLLALIDYLRSHADELHVDRDRITLWVFSGSGLLLAHALRVSPPYVRALVSYYAVLDLGASDRARPGAIPPEILNSFSPLRVLAERRDAVPPMLLARAGLDRPQVNESVDQFVRAAIAHNVSMDLLNHASGHHGFDIADDTDRSREILRRTIEFIRERNRD